MLFIAIFYGENATSYIAIDQRTFKYKFHISLIQSDVTY